MQNVRPYQNLLNQNLYLNKDPKGLSQVTVFVKHCQGVRKESVDFGGASSFQRRVWLLGYDEQISIPPLFHTSLPKGWLSALPVW